MWADIKVLSLGMATQIKRHRHSVIRLTQQEGHRSGARRVALKRFVDGAAHRPRAIAIEQHEQLRALLRGLFPFGEGSLQQDRALGNGQFETSIARGLARLELSAQQGLLMRRIENQLLTVIAAAMAGQLP